jgi:hypothetical protein
MADISNADRFDALVRFLLDDVDNELFRCCWCKQTFPRPHHKGRRPRACDEHKHLIKAHRENVRRREGKRVYPPCCLDAPGRVCNQHKQFRRFKYHWYHQPISQSDSEFLSSITEAGQLDGFHIV